MARINIEECWWSDPRRTALLLSIGFEADSAAINMWRVAQEFWSKGKALLPKSVFDKIKHSEALVEAGLADVRDSLVYVRGSSEYLTWLEEKRDQAREAGKKSADRPRDSKGRLLPKVTNDPAEVQRTSSESPAEPSAIQPSGSGSSSGSLIEEAPATPNPSQDFENRFSEESQKILEGLDKLGIKSSVGKYITSILRRFPTFEEFRDWANPVYKARDKDNSTEAEIKRYVIVALKKEIGVIREANAG